MSTQTTNPAAATTVAETPKKQESKKEPKVIAKIDLNTVKVDFGSAKKGDKFHIVSSGTIHGLAEYLGESQEQIVPLEKFLPRGVVHDFSIVPAE